MSDRKPIGQEIVIRVLKTPSGAKLTVRDGRGLAENVFTKRKSRYYYGESPVGDATDAAYREQERYQDRADCPVTVVELGEIEGDNDDPDPVTDGGDWNPEPAGLRDGETPDETSHAARNAAQLDMADGNGGGS